MGLQALALFQAAESDLEAGLVENQLALAYLAMGSIERARTTIRRARTNAVDAERLAAVLSDTEAMIELEAGNLDRALTLADQAIELSEHSLNQKGLLDALATRARTLSAMGRADDAAAAFERAFDLAERTAPASRRREILGAWADALAALGRHDEAFALARRALASR